MMVCLDRAAVASDLRNDACTSYEMAGRQFIVLPVTGGGKLGGPTGDAWMAFALPNRAPP